MNTKEYLYHYNENFKLESGSALPGFDLKYTTLGRLNSDQSNVVWVCHALTGSSNFMDWWGNLFVEVSPFDLTEYFIICANALGGCYGSTGPLSIDAHTGQPYYHNFPLLTNRDITNAFDLLRIHLGIKKIHTLIGGSLGGQQALTWAIDRPDLFENFIPIACNAVHSPWGIAINEAQRMAIEADPSWKKNNTNAGSSGLKAARAMSMITFRSPKAFQLQIENNAEKLNDYNASSYQRYQGDKLADRFNAFSYWTFTKAMDNHNVGRGYANVANALGRVNAKTLVIGLDSDLLFPPSEQKLIARGIPNAQFEIIHSNFGHDGFLIETKKLKKIIELFFHQQSKFVLQ